MKKKIIYLMTGVILSGFTAFAQDEAIADDAVVDTDALKPKAGDFGIGVSAIPYLNYLGNFFGKSNDNDLSLNGQTLYGKYFLTDASAVRAAFYVNNTTGINNSYSDDDAASAVDPTSTAQVIDTRKTVSRNVALTLGYEMRKDINRFAFVYGANLGYSFYTYNRETTHGNPITALNPDPNSNYGGTTTGGRELYYDQGNTHGVSAGLFAGVEYFIAKKFSVGADFSLNYYVSFSSQADTKFEAWDGSQVYEFETPTSPGNTNRGLSTSQYSSPTAAGQIYLLFHF